MNLQIQFPTKADCKNIELDNIALYTHFIYFNKQVCINKVRNQLVVCAFGFVPIDIDFDYQSVRFDTWYPVKYFHFTEIDKATELLQNLIIQILNLPDFIKKFV